MKNIVVYGTKKGSSEIYAKAFAKENDYPILEYTDLTSMELASVDRVYYFGSVYAGNVLGLEEVKKKVTENQSLVIISVGFTSIYDQEKLEEIQQGIIELFPDAEHVHLRGRLVKEQLKLPEKLIIKMISKSSAKKEEEEKLDIKKAIEAVVSEGKADYIDLAELVRIP